MTMIYFDKLLQTKHDVSMDKQNATKITIRLDSFAKDTKYTYYKCFALL